MKTGRNEQCPCGSSLKYKKCCLSRQEAAEAEAKRISELEFQEWFAQDLAEGAANLAAVKTLQSVDKGIYPKNKE